MIYLDNNATTPLDPAVLSAMLPYLNSLYGNPSSTHRFGQESRQAIERARFQIAALLGCDSKEILFTSGGTESNNAALLGLLTARAPRKTLITTTVEHSAIREPAQHLAKHGHTLLEIPVDSLGHLDLPALESALQNPDAALASIMWANNETGILFPIEKIAALCRQYKVPLHVDAVQAVGKIPINLAALPIDLLSISAHKFHGPKGTGALFIRRNTRWQPWQRGGPQERDRRGGTENVPALVGMGAAAELAQQSLSNGTTEKIATLRDHLEQQILSTIPNSHINGDPSSRLPNTTNIGFAGLEAEAILLLLSEQDLCASAGAACSSGSLEPSHVLRAMHIPDPIAHGAVRFSLSRFTTKQEIESALPILQTVITRLRTTLPL